MKFYKNNKKLIFTVIILILIAYIAQQFQNHTTPIVEETMATTTETIKSITHSNGIITFQMPDDFGLALNKEQILKSAYIPPCDDDFEYCLYYDGLEYIGTNFESAGLRIKNRTDLKTASTCLNTSPTNYTGLTSSIVASTTSYTVSSFQGIGDAGAGHYASGELFRLAYDGTCHEFETRVGASQFGNFAEGSIKEFTIEDTKRVMQELKDIILNITLKNGEKMSF